MGKIRRSAVPAVVATLLLGIAGCFPLPISPTGSVCRFAPDTAAIRVVLDPGVGGDYRFPVALGASRWNDAGSRAPQFVSDAGNAHVVDTVTIREVSRPDVTWRGLATVPCHPEAANPANQAYTRSATIELNRAKLGSSGETVAAVTAHELGHVLGLGHSWYLDGIHADEIVCDWVSLMHWNEQGQTLCSIVAPTDYDVTAVNHYYN